ncbi:mono/diheme cytochrome c family protein [Natronospira proteinivora]|uniref:Mono/diheme cytochrome c family protein n=1 Tax=Natronospira proteinivora TaxID=1807133 RepID=A0ABT1G7X1_9GAMM|nr:cytochrome c [Natronospira proteinivora]MCP1727406.1 mono/diheme cytochrome c family protein [Natronospira proteinivora]
MLSIVVLAVSVVAGIVGYALFIADGERGEHAVEEGLEGHELGYTLYEANCMACHGGDGQGREGDFPPLAGHVPEMLDRDGGRTYLIDVLVHGVAGETVIQGVSYNGFMPGFDQLSDEQLAELLNYLAHAWDNEQALPEHHEAITPAEVEERREHDPHPREVGESQPR